MKVFMVNGQSKLVSKVWMNSPVAGWYCMEFVLRFEAASVVSWPSWFVDSSILIGGHSDDNSFKILL